MQKQSTCLIFPDINYSEVEMLKTPILMTIQLLLGASISAYADFQFEKIPKPHFVSEKTCAEIFLEERSLEEIHSILDVGCGDGSITALMARHIQDGHVHGIDISAQNIELAVNKFKDLHNLSFEIQDASSLKVTVQYDLVTTFMTMHWVLKQKEALACFQKALKPGGILWVQIPMILPQEMKEALALTLSSERFHAHFMNFCVPWKFYQAEEYEKLLLEAEFEPVKIEVNSYKEIFSSREEFISSLKTWLPYLKTLPEEEKDPFLSELVDHYLNIVPPDENGSVYFTVDRLEIEALKPL